MNQINNWNQKAIIFNPMLESYKFEDMNELNQGIKMRYHSQFRKRQMKTQVAKTLKYQSKDGKDFSSSNVLSFVEDHTLIFDLEPLHRILLRNSMLDSNAGLASTATTDTVPRAFQHNIEVHPINTSWRVIPVIKTRKRTGAFSSKSNTPSPKNHKDLPSQANQSWA